MVRLVRFEWERRSSERERLKRDKEGVEMRSLELEVSR
jgi:hypothetical protein